MTSLCIDLHCHSTYSDGTLSPQHLVERAYQNGVDVLALTDHDSTRGLADAREVAQSLGIRLINGVEISVTWNQTVLHIVGLNIDPQKSSIAIKFSANFFFTQGIKKINLFGIKTLHSFKIRSFNKTFAILNNNKIDLPDNFIKTLLGISISSSRGMMAVLNTNPAYQKYNIPLMNPTELIETMMKH